MLFGREAISPPATPLSPLINPSALLARGITVYASPCSVYLVPLIWKARVLALSKVDGCATKQAACQLENSRPEPQEKILQPFRPEAPRLTNEVSPNQFENNYFTEMCSGSEAGSYLRLIDLVYHSTLGLRVIKTKRRARPQAQPAWRQRSSQHFSDTPPPASPPPPATPETKLYEFFGGLVVWAILKPFRTF